MMYNSILQTTNNKIPTTVGGSIYCSGDQYSAWGINIGLGGSIKNSGGSTSFSPGPPMPEVHPKWQTWARPTGCPQLISATDSFVERKSFPPSLNSINRSYFQQSHNINFFNSLVVHGTNKSHGRT